VHQQGENWITALLPFVIIGVVVGFRLKSMSKERPLKLSTLWIVPVVYLLIAGWMMFALPPTPTGWMLMIAGLAVGIGLGWYRGKLIHIHRDEESGQLLQKASPLAMILLLGLIVLKLGSRAIFGEMAATHPGSGAMLLTDTFIGFALGLLSATRLELYLRAKKMFAAQ
jgi:hypothetical protein